jgi:hypothetical protein
MKTVERKKGSGVYLIKCPGCNEIHSLATTTTQSNGARWGFNGSTERPTFSPSYLLRSGHYVPGYTHDHCWCTYNREHPEDKGPECVVCHSFIRDGEIQFLGDCTHHLKGQTVPLPELDEEFIDIHTID